MYKDIEGIKNLISNNQDFSRMIASIDDIAIMEWDGNCIDGSLAMSLYLEESNQSEGKIRQIILLGKNNKQIRQNKKELEKMFHDAEVLIVGKDWRTADIYSLHIRHTFVIHVASISKLSDEPVDLFYPNENRNQMIVRESRCAYYAVITSPERTNLFDSSFDCNVLTTLDNFSYDEPDIEEEKTPLCIEKTEGFDKITEEVSDESAFFMAMDEVKNGCETCNQCTNYGKAKQCPAAQRLIADFYGSGRYVPKGLNIEYQWELKSANQGYKPAIIAIAKHLSVGRGCERDVNKSLDILDGYARKGDVECSKRIIRLVRRWSDANKLIALPHIVRLAQDGDDDMCLLLSKAFKEGDYGLPVDKDQEKAWIQKGAENGNPELIKSLALLYEEDEDLENTIKWYRRLQEVSPDDVDEEYITGKEKKLLASMGGTPHGTAELGFKYYNGYDVEYNPRLAFLCFSISAEAGDLLGENGLGVFYKNGVVVEKNIDTAIELFNASVQKGSIRSAYALYDIFNNYEEYNDSEEGEYWKQIFLDILSDGIENGDPYAYRLKACLLRKGEIYSKDLESALEMFEKAEFGGDYISSYYIGRAYLDGDGTEKNIDKALAIFSELASHGYYKAKGELGRYYYLNHGYSYNDAFPLLKEAAECAYNRSYLYLAKSYEYGRGTSVDKNEAYQWYIKSAEAGNSSAMGILCEEYYNGVYLPKDYVKSVEWGKKAYAKGNANTNVRFRLAWLLSDGKSGGVELDKELSFNLYSELAEEGNTTAMNNLGWMYEFGHYVESNPSKAFELYLKAAESNDSFATHNVAYCYRRGIGVEQDYDKSREWFIKGAERGDATSMRELANLYKGNYGTEVNSDKVIEWYQKAIDAGDNDSITDLGYAYELGTVLEKSYQNALVLYKKAAKKGLVKGYYNLASMYQEGHGVDKDDQTAIYWYRKAAAKGFFLAKNRLKELGINWVDEDQNVTDKV